MVRVNREAEGGGGAQREGERVLKKMSCEREEGRRERESREVRGVHCCKGRLREKVREI